MKRLRRYYEHHYNHKPIRFFMCGEYGPTATTRPHYHAIIFNLPIPDLKYLKTNFNGHQLFTSEIMSKIWGKG